MSYFNNNNILGGYYPSEDDTFDWYSFGADDQPIAGPSGSQDPHSHPPSEKRVALSEYQGYTLLDEAGCQSTNPYALRTGYAYDDFSTGESCT